MTVTKLMMRVLVIAALIMLALAWCSPAIAAVQLTTSNLRDACIRSGEDRIGCYGYLVGVTDLASVSGAIKCTRRYTGEELRQIFVRETFNHMELLSKPKPFAVLGALLASGVCEVNNPAAEIQ